MPKDAEVWGFYFAAMGAFHGLLAPLVVAIELPLFPINAFLIGGGTGYVVGLILHGLPRRGLPPMGFLLGGLWGGLVGLLAGLFCLGEDGAGILGLYMGAVSGSIATGLVIWPFAKVADAGRDPGPVVWVACALSPVAPVLIARGLAPGLFPW